MADLTADPAPPVAPTAGFDGTAYRVLREARGLSQADAALMASALLPDHPVSEDQVRVLERDGNPRPRLLRSRLDSAYRADGVTCVEELPVDAGAPGTFAVTFPPYWIGPVWVTVLADRGDGGDPAPGPVQLAFGRHRKQVIARPGTTVTCRRSIPEKEPLRVACPPGWRVRAGLGARPDARDVNWGWRDVNDASTRGDAPVHELFLGLFGRSRADFEQLLDRGVTG